MHVSGPREMCPCLTADITAVKNSPRNRSAFMKEPYRFSHVIPASFTHVCEGLCDNVSPPETGRRWPR